MSWQVVEGDALARLRELPDGSVQACVTSPPYYGLRDYRVEGQIGLEPTLGEYIDRLVEVFAEVRRVLRVDGTLWLNLGDSYAAKPRGSDQGWDKSRLSNPGRLQKAQAASLRRGRRTRGEGAKEKDLLMVPALVALGLRDEGWWLRDEIIWHKPAPMPSSARDRTCRAHEVVYMLSKAKSYFYDQAAIAEEFADARMGRDGGSRGRERDRGGRSDGFTTPSGIDPSSNAGRVKRSVWTVSAQPFSWARYDPDSELDHFAVFPEKLVEPCVLAGAPAGALVLDPFCGAGTVGVVAMRLGRRFLGIDLNPDYCAMARRRIADDAPLFNAMEV